jgi:hypothetical protein
LSKVKDAIDQVRGETQDLYKTIEASTTKNHAAIRTDLQDVATQAQRLASSLKTISNDQRTDTKQHLEHAASLLEAAAADAKTVATATNADLREMNVAMLERTRDAVGSVSRAVASKRSAAVKEHA